MTASITKPKTLKMKRRMKMIDTRIGNRNDAIELADELICTAKTLNQILGIKEGNNALVIGLEALKEAIEKEVI